MRDGRIQGGFVKCIFAPDKDTSPLGLKEPKTMAWLS